MKALSLMVFAVALTLGGGARATVILELDLNRIVGRSQMIFIGKAVRAHSHWTADRKHIVTDTTFQVERGVQGIASGQEVVIRHYGGAVGGIGMQISGTPSFSSNARTLLFTRQRGGHLFVVGMRQGAYHIFNDARGQARVRADLNGLTLARRSSSGTKIVPRSSRAPQLLQDFIGRIRQAMRFCAREKTRCSR